MQDLIDVCVNVTNSQFAADRAAVLTRAEQHGVVGMLFTATDLTTTRESLALCDGGSRLCTAGIHPHDAKDAPANWRAELEALASNPMVRAVGECGLDFNRSFSPHDVQIDVFEQQIAVAKSLNKPLFVHDRESAGAVLACLAKEHPLPPTVIHCFTGTQEELSAYVDLGFYIGITGWVCDPGRGTALREMVARVPIDQLLIETDAPFLRPHNEPGEFHRLHGLPRRRNEPALLGWIIQALAELRDEPLHTLADATRQNAQTLFGFN